MLLNSLMFKLKSSALRETFGNQPTLEGATPYAFLKANEKCEKSLKPTSIYTSVDF